MFGVFIEIVGWMGAGLLLLGYLLLLQEKVTFNSLVYLLLNLAATVGLCTACLYQHAYQSFSVNIATLLVTIAGLMAYIKKSWKNSHPVVV